MAVIEWDGGVGGPVAVPALVPLGGDGLALARPFGPGLPSGGPAAVAGVPRGLLVRAGLGVVARHPEVGPVAVWPVEVPALRTALALVVAGLLAAARPVGSVAPVVCAGRPPMGRARGALCHDVRADVGGRRVELVVWEVLAPVAARPAGGWAA